MSGANNLGQRATAGGPEASYDLGTRFEAKGDPKRPCEWFEKAAALDDAAAVRALGVLEQFHGPGTDAAREWYLKAAEFGQSIAVVNLGGLAEEYGDLNAARECWLKAAELGNADVIDLLNGPDE